MRALVCAIGVSAPLDSLAITFHAMGRIGNFAVRKTEFSAVKFGVKPFSIDTGKKSGRRRQSTDQAYRCRTEPCGFRGKAPKKGFYLIFKFR